MGLYCMLEKGVQPFATCILLVATAKRPSKLTSVEMIHAMREPLDILLSFRIFWRYSEKGEQELKAQLFNNVVRLLSVSCCLALSVIRYFIGKDMPFANEFFY